ncbi:hypothetical protein MMC17_000328 [Xylographa soralifera]|nr:hypothetical protein [Xylographa soralifera]
MSADTLLSLLGALIRAGGCGLLVLSLFLRPERYLSYIKARGSVREFLYQQARALGLILENPLIIPTPLNSTATVNANFSSSESAGSDQDSDESESTGDQDGKDDSSHAPGADNTANAKDPEITMKEPKIAVKKPRARKKSTPQGRQPVTLVSIMLHVIELHRMSV